MDKDYLQSKIDEVEKVFKQNKEQLEQTENILQQLKDQKQQQIGRAGAFQELLQELSDKEPDAT